MNYRRKLLILASLMMFSVFFSLIVMMWLFGSQVALNDHHGLPGFVPLAVVIAWAFILEKVTRKDRLISKQQKEKSP